MSTLVRVRSAYGRVLTICGWVAGLVTFAVMCLVVANVLGRYALNAPIAGTLELTEGALPLIIFLSIALTQFHGGHIRVTILTDRLPAGARRAMTVAAMIAGGILFAWAAWAGWIAAEKSWGIGEMKRGSIRFPVWPIKFVVCAGMVLLAVQFVIDAICAAVGLDLDGPAPETVE